MKEDLKTLFDSTKKECDKKEHEIVKLYISFLRKVARHYLMKGAKVFFHENKVVHWAEGGFGSLMIEYAKNESENNFKYYLDIKFVSKIDKKNVVHFEKITLKNLNDISYRLF